MSSMSYVGWPRSENPFSGQNPFGVQNSFGRLDDDHAGKDLCPPGSKTEEPKTAFADMSILHYPVSTDPIGECKYCLKVGKHYTAGCPYRECVPKGATVSSCCEILCRNCSGLFTEKCCGLDEGRAILKQCAYCGPCSDHWTPMFPLKCSIPMSMDLAPEKSKVAAAGHFMASYSPLYHCVTVQFSNDEHGGKDLWPPGQYRNGAQY